MTPTATGRHCVACQKVVVDFTQKTDAEILAYLARAGSHSCGRFRVSQLGRPLALPAEPKRWRTLLGALLTAGGLLGSERASAQRAAPPSGGGPAPIVTKQSSTTEAVVPAAPSAPVVAPATGPDGPLTLHGVVVDTRSGDALPGVTVLLKGTTLGTSTNANGEFTLQVSGDKSNLVLVASFVGYTINELPIDVTTTQAMAPLQLKLEASVTGGMVYIRPYPWHPRAFFGWSKYWLTRPFRR